MQQHGSVVDSTKTNLDDLSLELWLTLNAMPKLGPVAVEELISSGLITAAARQNVNALKAAGLSPRILESIAAADKHRVKQDLTWLNKADNRYIIPLDDARYPPLLNEIRAKPLVLFCEGNITLLKAALFAIVGSRACSTYGQRNAKTLSAELAKSGWGVVSGMAIGIDTYAHQGCIEAGGNTVAVLGTGLAQTYPKRNRYLRDNIIANDGCIVSEFSVDTAPRAENFPRRNRIISGLSYGSLIVEAMPKSGSLITAKYALEQNREVFALPGSINNPLSSGCHQLLKNGAKLVESVSDINEEFLFLLQSVASESPKIGQKKANESLASDQLLASVDYEATCLDVVVQRSRLPVSEVTAKLLEYELRGLVASVPGGYIRLGE